jgi:hypothetical protein
LPNPVRNDEHSYISHELLLFECLIGAPSGAIN